LPLRPLLRMHAADCAAQMPCLVQLEPADCETRTQASRGAGKALFGIVLIGDDPLLVSAAHHPVVSASCKGRTFFWPISLSFGSGAVGPAGVRPFWFNCWILLACPPGEVGRANVLGRHKQAKGSNDASSLGDRDENGRPCIHALIAALGGSLHSKPSSLRSFHSTHSAFSGVQAQIDVEKSFYHPSISGCDDTSGSDA